MSLFGQPEQHQEQQQAPEPVVQYVQQEQQQPQQDEQQAQAYFPNIYSQQKEMVQPSDVIKYRLESEDLLDSLEHDLRGEQQVINKDGSTKWRPKYGRWISDEGLSIIKSIVARYNNRGCYLANLNPDQINCCSRSSQM